jgi:hypothetical protein
MSKWGFIAGLLFGLCCIAMWGKISDCRSKGGVIVCATCIKKDAIL